MEAILPTMGQDERAKPGRTNQRGTGDVVIESGETASKLSDCPGGLRWTLAS